MLAAYPNIVVPTAIPPRNRRSETIAENLRHLITSGQLKPGAKLPTEAQLCQHFQVSRTTLREATQMLRTNGLLDVTPGRGSFVRLPDVEPLLADLALASRASAYLPQGYTGTASPTLAESYALLPQLLTPLLPGICQRPEGARHALLRHITQPKLAAADNAALEEAWLGTLPDIAQQHLVGILVKLLLAITAEQRVAAFDDDDTVLRQRHLQLRCSNALIEGDMGLAERVLQHYFVITAEAGKPAASKEMTPPPFATLQQTAI